MMNSYSDKKYNDVPPDSVVDGPVIGNRRNYSLVTVEVLQAFINGDHRAFEHIFICYYEKLRFFIAALVKSNDVAEEMAQDIFVNLWEHRDKVNPYKNFNSYLYTIARNSVFNYAKSRNVRSRYAEQPINSDDFLSIDAEDIIVAEETKLLVDLAVERMPKQRKMIYEMSRNQGLTNEEISKRLNITRNAVDKQLRLALLDVRNILAFVSMFAIFILSI